MPEHCRKTLFDLPHEIRLQVYRYLFRGTVVSLASYVRVPCSRPAMASIFRACRDCYNEARPIFLQTACFNFGNPSSTYQPAIHDEMKRMIGASQLHLIHHIRVPLPYTYESWSNDVTMPYKKLKTLTIAIGLSHLGAARLPSEPTNAEYMTEMTTHDGLRHKANDPSAAIFDNGPVMLMWVPPELFVFNYIRRRNATKANYKVYIQTRPDILSELEQKDPSYRQELSFLRLCSFEEIEAGAG